MNSPLPLPPVTRPLLCVCWVSACCGKPPGEDVADFIHNRTTNRCHKSDTCGVQRLKCPARGQTTRRTCGGDPWLIRQVRPNLSASTVTYLCLSAHKITSFNCLYLHVFVSFPVVEPVANWVVCVCLFVW